MIRSLIMDFDGLIVDTEAPAFQAWVDVYRAHGLNLPFSAWAARIGGSIDMPDSWDQFEADLGRPVDRDTLRPAKQKREAELIEAQPILPGVTTYIADAKRLGLKLGMASSSTRQWVTGHLSRLGLVEHFECIKCSDDVERTKPDPEVYRATLDALGVAPHEAIVLEDSANGVRAAKLAGIFCVVIPNMLTRRLQLDHADLRMDSLEDLPLEELVRRVEEYMS